MSNIVQGYMWNIEFPNPLAKIIALKLADNANDEGGDIYPATTTIAKRAGCARSSVCKWQFALEHCGLLTVVNRSAGGSRSDTTERAYDMELVLRLARMSRERPPELMLVAAEIERPATNRDGTAKVDAAGAAVMVRIPVFEVKPYEEPVRQEDGLPVRETDGSEGDPSARRTLAVRQTDTSRPPDGHEPFKGIPSFNSPPLPPKGGEGEGEGISNSKEAIPLVEELIADGQPEHVAEELIGWLLRAGLQPWKDVPSVVGAARQLCADLKATRIAVLEAARTRIRKSARYRLPPPADILAAVEAAEKEINTAASERLRLEREAERRREADPELAKRSGALRDAIRQRVGGDVFAAWFETLACESCEGGKLVVSIPLGDFVRNWVRTQFEQVLAEAAGAVFGPVKRVDVVAPPSGRARTEAAA